MRIVLHWLLILAVLIFFFVIARTYFLVPHGTYQRVDTSEIVIIDTSKAITAPNGRLLTDSPDATEKVSNDATFGTIFPYLAAPHSR
jgi:hypothetical protein